MKITDMMQSRATFRQNAFSRKVNGEAQVGIQGIKPLEAVNFINLHGSKILHKK